MTQNTVQVTEREFKMEASLQGLVKRNTKAVEEMTMMEGTLAFQKAQLDNANKAIKDLEWAKEYYEKHMKSKKLRVPKIPEKPTTTTKTIDIPGPTKE